MTRRFLFPFFFAFLLLVGPGLTSDVQSEETDTEQTGCLECGSLIYEDVVTGQLIIITPACVEPTDWTSYGFASCRIQDGLCFESNPCFVV